MYFPAQPTVLWTSLTGVALMIILQSLNLRVCLKASGSSAGGGCNSLALAFCSYLIWPLEGNVTQKTLHHLLDRSCCNRPCQVLKDIENCYVKNVKLYQSHCRKECHFDRRTNSYHCWYTVPICHSTASNLPPERDLLHIYSLLLCSIFLKQLLHY